MRIDVVTLFPGMFEGPMSESIIKRAQEAEVLDLRITDLREYSKDKHRKVDDRPFGGGAGMVIKAEVVFDCIEAMELAPGARVILTDPQGVTFTQKLANEFSEAPQLVFLCGHYEGFDERVREHLVTDEISIGDYVLTGGELPAMVMIDAVVRLLPGAIGKIESTHEDSFYTGLLDHPHYTRPESYRGWEVPEVLRSGNHQAIARWRREQALLRTYQRRPDLLPHAPLTKEDRKFLKECCGWVAPV